MKFGHVLRTTAEELPEVQTLFLVYKKLKKQLKRLPAMVVEGEGAEKPEVLAGTTEEGPTSGREVGEHQAGGSDSTAVCSARTHPASTSSVLSLTREEAVFIETLCSQLQLMNDMFLEREETSVIRLEMLEAEARGQRDMDRLRDVYRRFVNFHGEVLLLVHWSVLAYTATVKILKKHHKRLGLLVRAPQLSDLLSQPFCSTELMMGLAHKAENAINTIVARLRDAGADLGSEAPGASAADGDWRSSAPARGPKPRAGMSSSESVSDASCLVGPGSLADQGSAAQSNSSSEDLQPESREQRPSACAQSREEGALPLDVSLAERKSNDECTKSSNDPKAGTSVGLPNTQSRLSISGSVADVGNVPQELVPKWSGAAPPPKSIVRMAQVALMTWEHLKRSASTPSTILDMDRPVKRPNNDPDTQNAPGTSMALSNA